MARERDRSPYQRFVATDEQLLEAGLEQLVESAAARLTIRSQHEVHFRRNVEVPASEHLETTFYDAAEPERPTPGEVEDRTDVFPLRATLAVGTCGQCRGKEEISCGRCRGQKKISCLRCRGTGQSSIGTIGTRGRSACHICGGSGSRQCSGCRGRGVQICSACCGEGETARC